MIRNSIFIVLIGVLTACQTIIEIDTSLEKPILVVNSLFAPDSTWELSLTQSRSIFDNSNSRNFPPVGDGAVVTILDENNAFIETLTFTPEKDFHYTGKTIPKIGRTYNLHIDVENEVGLEATSRIPAPASIISIKQDSSLYESEEVIKVDLVFHDPQNEINYYQIKILKKINSSLGDESIPFSPIDPALKNDYSNGSLLLSDKYFNGKDYQVILRVNRSGYRQITSPVRLVLETISEEHFKYFDTKNVQDRANGDPFAQPVQIYSNINNGLGIFAGYSSTVVLLN